MYGLYIENKHKNTVYNRSYKHIGYNLSHNILNKRNIIGFFHRTQPSQRLYFLCYFLYIKYIFILHNNNNKLLVSPHE